MDDDVQQNEGTELLEQQRRQLVSPQLAPRMDARVVVRVETAFPAPPTSCVGYLRSIGPGLVMALTWLGAGDLVDTAVAGGDYGYALAWALPVSFAVRFIFASILAKFHLCNVHRYSLPEALLELHPVVAWGVAAIAAFFAHFNDSYMIRGIGETSAALVGTGPVWAWSSGWIVVIGLLVLGPGGGSSSAAYRQVEKIFYAFLVLLSVSLIGTAIQTRPNPGSLLRGLMLLQQPVPRGGNFSVLMVVVSLIGAIGGSAANLMYPGFLKQKGWNGPMYRRVQLYDLAFGTFAIVMLDLAVWTIGAEVLHPSGAHVTNLDDLAGLLTQTLGAFGGPLFYLGALAALLSSVIGNAAGYGELLSEFHRVLWPHDNDEFAGAASQNNLAKFRFRVWVMWVLLPPLIWSAPGAPGFVTLTVIVNAANVVALPFLTLSVWLLTSSKRLIGGAHVNRWWEHGILCGLFVLALWAARQSSVSIADALHV